MITVYRSRQGMLETVPDLEDGGWVSLVALIVVFVFWRRDWL